MVVSFVYGELEKTNARANKVQSWPTSSQKGLSGMLVCVYIRVPKYLC